MNIVLRNPLGGAELRDLPGQLDTAADRTVLPDGLVRSLDLPQVGVIRVAGLGGVTYTLPEYAVLLGLHDFLLQPMKVAAHSEETWALLGRDVLNAFRLLLDGPQRALEIG